MKSRHIITPALLACLIVLSSPHAVALTPTFTISAERVEQHFSFGEDEVDSTIDAITLTPGLTWGNWQVSATLPWQSIDGQYFFNNLYPNLAQTCSQINSLSPLQRWLLQRNTKLNEEALDYCAETAGVESRSENDHTSGWNDVEVFANYYIPSTSTWLAGSLGLGYQHDNGDEFEGLGNGARQLFAETTWMAAGNRLSLSTTLGYFFVIEDNSAVGINDHGYGALDARLLLSKHIELGVRYDYQQTDNDVFDDYDYWTYSLHFYAGQHWGGQAYVTDYDDEPGFPDEEYGLYFFYAI